MRIALVGATGYVGLTLVDALLRRGHAVSATLRPTSLLLLGGRNVTPLPDDASVGSEPYDAIVNLAYPTSGSNITYRKQNIALVRRLSALASKSPRVIHVSTLAVFGYALDRPVMAGPVATRFDDSYIESKLQMESLIAAAFPNRSADIVRLGNVWGPGSPAWTAALSDKLLFGEPVGVRTEDGYSNTTDVANVASYLIHLIESPPTSKELRFHHLAEFSHLRWSHWVNKLSTALAVAPVETSAATERPQTLWQDVRSAVQPGMPISILRSLYAGTISGAAMRRMLSFLPAFAQARAKSMRAPLRAPARRDQDSTFLSVLGCDTQFRSVLVDGWTPPLDASASWDAVSTWMNTVGYVRATVEGKP